MLKFATCNGHEIYLLFLFTLFNIHQDLPVWNISIKNSVCYWLFSIMGVCYIIYEMRICNDDVMNTQTGYEYTIQKITFWQYVFQYYV